VLLALFQPEVSVLLTSLMPSLVLPLGTTATLLKRMLRLNADSTNLPTERDAAVPLLTAENGSRSGLVSSLSPLVTVTVSFCLDVFHSANKLRQYVVDGFTTQPLLPSLTFSLFVLSTPAHLVAMYLAPLELLATLYQMSMPLHPHWFLNQSTPSLLTTLTLLSK